MFFCSYVLINYLGWRVIQQMLPYTIERMLRAQYRFDRYRYTKLEMELVSRQCYRATVFYMRFAVGRIFYDRDKHKPTEREQKARIIQSEDMLVEMEHSSDTPWVESDDLGFALIWIYTRASRFHVSVFASVSDAEFRAGILFNACSGYVATERGGSWSSDCRMIPLQRQTVINTQQSSNHNSHSIFAYYMQVSFVSTSPSLSLPFYFYLSLFLLLFIFLLPSILDKVQGKVV